MACDSAAMKMVEDFFEDKGYKVLSLSYPSNDFDEHTLVENVVICS